MFKFAITLDQVVTMARVLVLDNCEHYELYLVAVS